MRWTADGAHILFTYGRAVWAVTADGSRLWRLARSWREGSPFFPSVGRTATFNVSPDGKHVIFATCAYLPERFLEAGSERPTRYDFDHELAIVGLDGQAARRLTRHRAFDSYPAWSPDGTRIAFVSNRYTSGVGQLAQTGLFTMAADGTDVQRLARGLRGVAFQPPAWSPDGRSIAVAAPEERSVGHALYLADAAGAGYVRLTETVSGGAWSPDGTRLVFAKPEGAVVMLYTIAADGSDAQRVKTAPRWRGWIPTVAWSPDGSKLLYACGDRQFCVVTVAGRTVGATATLDGRRTVGANPLLGHRAVWSPDGKRIAVSNRPLLDLTERTILYTALPDGSDVEPLVLWERARSRPYLYTALAPIAAQARDEDLALSRAACTAGVVVPAPEANPGLVQDCKTLLAARAALFGGKLVNWGSGTPLENWEGVTVTGAPPRVTTVALTGLEVAGPIPPVLGSLGHLQQLYLSNNGFTGAIPPELGALRHLSRLWLQANRLTGPIPAELRQLTNLTLLDLRRNDLSGAIPPELGQLQNLERLLLAENHLTGAIPPELGQLRKLERLLLAENRLTGAIPPELGALGQLIGLWLHRNELTGPIPVELGQLARLRGLNLASNQLTGTIPPALVQLRYLGGPGLSRDAASNQWAGLFLDGNRLTGCIPVGLKRVPRNDLGYLNLPDCEAGA